MANKIQARVSLVVTGEAITANEITEEMGLQPTTIWKKGESFNGMPTMLVENSEWRHAVQLSKPIGHDADLDDFLEYLIAHKSALKKLIAGGMTVVLRLYVQSDAVQMVYQLMPGTLRLLSDLGMTLEVSSVSWGDAGV